MARGKRDYSTVNMFVSKIKLFVIYETTFKKLKLVTRKSCAISCWEDADHGLIKWRINGEIIDKNFLSKSC